jgi:hypothetical protein
MTARYSARRAVQAETRFPLKVSPKFPLARSLRERSPGLGLSLARAVRPHLRGRNRQRENTSCQERNSACSSTHSL